MRTTFAMAMLACAPLWAACNLKLTQALTPTDLETTERSAFTSDGRFFVIGTRAANRSDAGSWIVEVTKSGESYVSTNVVFGALEGTAGGVVGGAPVGDPCFFSGLTVNGLRLYAACFANDASRAALIEVDVQARTVRADYFTTCNAEPSKVPCENTVFYPNGMGMDAEGRIYLSNTASHLDVSGALPAITVEGSRTLTQVVVNPNPTDPAKLSFTHHDWFSTDIFRDGLAPNGVQIEGSTLYYAAGANINRIEIRPDGTPGAAAVHFAGPALTMIDDFVVSDGRMVLGRALPPELAAIDRAPAFGTAREIATKPMSLDAIPSSISLQRDVPGHAPLFPANSLIITSYFGGGLYVLTGLPGD